MKDLQCLLNELVLAKDNLKKAKEIEDTLNKQVKERLDVEGISKDTIGDIKVTYTTYTKSSMNEDKLLQIVKGLSVEQPELIKCIETKEYINESVLEELIYEGIITVDDIQPAYEEKQYKTLKLKRVK